MRNTRHVPRKRTMRFRFRPMLCAATLLGTLSGGGQAFIATRTASSRRWALTSTSTFSSPFGIGSGWDNDGYLDSLAGGDDTVPGEETYPVVEPEEERPPVAVAVAVAPSQQEEVSSSGWDASPQSSEQHQQHQQQEVWHGLQESGGQYGNRIQQHQQTQPGVGSGGAALLPLGWTEYFDAGSGRSYYHNANDGTTTWDRPVGPEGIGSTIPSFDDQSTTSGGAYQDESALFGRREQSSTSQAWGLASGDAAEEEDDDDSSLSVEQQDDELPTKDIEGAVLTDEMKAKVKASHTEEEEASQGGQKFRALMEKAKQAQRSGAIPAGRGGAQQIEMPPNSMNLPIEEYARLYSEMVWRKQNPVRVSGPQRKYLPPGTGIDGRKIGRNRDAETISNKADAYLAQLRRDSTVRTLARHSGDVGTANAEPLSHPSVAEIQAPEENPYLAEQRERERNMLETVPEEMLIFQEYDQPDPKLRSDSGISYKDKLEQARRNRQSSSSAQQN